VKPDAVAVGWSTYVGNKRGKTIRADGTSFSSPLMSGMVACLWQAFPTKNAYEIMEAIRMSGDRAAEPDSSLGYGITDMLKAYNLLLQKPNEKFTFDIKEYDIIKNEINVTITVKEPMVLLVTHNLASDPQKIKVKKIKLKVGANNVVIKTAKIDKATKYDFVALKVQELGSSSDAMNFVVGYDNPKKK
jgi:subtilase family serine protease